ncbi:hypothetical protein [Paractinoplanes toevensis]|nr:hypothetical protein [Actinoplanes toevensis]
MKAIRIWLAIFVVGLVLSGVTAFPLVTEVRLLADVLHQIPAPEALRTFIDHVRDGLVVTGESYPFIAYGTDWLAFAHLAIAMAFIGPWRDPVRNIWVIEWAMLCCIAIVPLALIAGPIRHLPWWWLPIDISFGVFGIVPLLIVRRLIRRLDGQRKRAAKNSPQ